MPQPLNDLKYAQTTLSWLEQEKRWPGSLRHLETDAIGLTLLVSLFQVVEDSNLLCKAKQLVSDVHRVLGRRKGFVSSEDADCQDYMPALGCLGKIDSSYHDMAVALAKDIHPHFFDATHHGVIPCMSKDLDGPYKGFYGYNITDAVHGYCIFKDLDPKLLQDEIADLKTAVDRVDLNCQMHCCDLLNSARMLVDCHLVPKESWVPKIVSRIFTQLDKEWTEERGFCGSSFSPHDLYALSVGIQAIVKASEDLEEQHIDLGDPYDGVLPLLSATDCEKWMARVSKHNDLVESLECRSPCMDCCLNDLMAAVSRFPGCLIRDSSTRSGTSRLVVMSESPPNHN